jgi:AAA family ATP:ADP antiporter
MSEVKSRNPVSRFIRSATKIEPDELSATLLSFTFVLVLMTAYFIMRPVRDAM